MSYESVEIALRTDRLHRDDTEAATQNTDAGTALRRLREQLDAASAALDTLGLPRRVGGRLTEFRARIAMLANEIDAVQDAALREIDASAAAGETIDSDTALTRALALWDARD